MTTFLRSGLRNYFVFIYHYKSCVTCGLTRALTNQDTTYNLFNTFPTTVRFVLESRRFPFALDNFRVWIIVPSQWV